MHIRVHARARAVGGRVRWWDGGDGGGNGGDGEEGWGREALCWLERAPARVVERLGIVLLPLRLGPAPGQEPDMCLCKHVHISPTRCHQRLHDPNHASPYMTSLSMLESRSGG